MGDQELSGLNIQPSLEVMPEGNKTGIVVTVATGLAVVIALLAISNYVLENYSPNLGYRLFDSKWELLLRQHRPVDVLVLGDSSMNQGIDTEFLKAMTGLDALNLATIGDAIAVNDHWMLEEYIDRVGPPVCVVVGHVYDVWYRPIHYPLVARVPIDSSSLRNRLSELYSDRTVKLGVQLELLIAEYFKGFSENQSMTTLLTRPWTAQISSMKLLKSGFHPSYGAEPDNVTDDAKGHIDFVRSQVFEPSHENRSSLEQMVDLANRYKFRLYIINSPLYEGLTKDENFKRYLSNVNTFISEAMYQSDYATHLFAAPITYGTHEMQNADHLIATAAENFTQKVIDRIDCRTQ